MIYTRPRYERAWRKLTHSQQTAVNAAVARLEEGFGRPHAHSGLGLRVLFLNEGGDLFLCFVGDHDQVRAFIKRGKSVTSGEAGGM